MNNAHCSLHSKLPLVPGLRWVISANRPRCWRTTNGRENSGAWDQLLKRNLMFYGLYFTLLHLYRGLPVDYCSNSETNCRQKLIQGPVQALKMSSQRFFFFDNYSEEAWLLWLWLGYTVFWARPNKQHNNAFQLNAQEPDFLCKFWYGLQIHFTVVVHSFKPVVVVVVVYMELIFPQ